MAVQYLNTKQKNGITFFEDKSTNETVAKCHQLNSMSSIQWDTFLKKAETCTREYVKTRTMRQCRQKGRNEKPVVYAVGCCNGAFMLMQLDYTLVTNGDISADARLVSSVHRAAEQCFNTRVSVCRLQ
ncbi:MAG: hypothetical protein K1W06_04805 [Lachnospiraceae bacterium]